MMLGDTEQPTDTQMRDMLVFGGQKPEFVDSTLKDGGHFTWTPGTDGRGMARLINKNGQSVAAINSSVQIHNNAVANVLKSAHSTQRQLDLVNTLIEKPTLPVAKTAVTAITTSPDSLMKWLPYLIGGLVLLKLLRK